MCEKSQIKFSLAKHFVHKYTNKENKQNGDGKMTQTIQTKNSKQTHTCKSTNKNVFKQNLHQNAISFIEFNQIIGKMTRNTLKSLFVL